MFIEPEVLGEIIGELLAMGILMTIAIFLGVKLRKRFLSDKKEE